MRPLYLYFLVPSSISFTMSFFMFINIVFSKKLQNQFFQQLSATIALADMIQCGSWFVGGKWDSPFVICASQEYFLQGGCLFKAFTTILICGISTVVILTLHVPKINIFHYSSILYFMMPALCIFISVYYKTARLFCGNQSQYESSSADSRNAVLSYGLAFLLPIYMCVVVDFLLYIYISHAIRKKYDTSGESEEQQLLMSSVKRIKIYPLLFAVGWFPELINYAYAAFIGPAPHFMIVISCFSISSVGIGTSFFYFYYQRVFVDIKSFLNQFYERPSDNNSQLLLWSQDADNKRRFLSSNQSNVSRGSTYASRTSVDPNNRESSESAFVSPYLLPKNNTL
jgi:hypothetical protein